MGKNILIVVGRVTVRRGLLDNLKCVLPDDASASLADVQVLPKPFFWFDDLSRVIARVKALVDWRVATNADPCIRVTRLMGNVFDGGHVVDDWLIISTRPRK